MAEESSGVGSLPGQGGSRFKHERHSLKNFNPSFIWKKVTFFKWMMMIMMTKMMRKTMIKMLILQVRIILWHFAVSYPKYV